MAKKVRHLRFAFGLVLAAVTIEPGFSSESFKIYLRNPGMTTRNLGRLSAAKLYSLSLSVPSPLTLRTSVVRVTIKDPHTLIAAKTLHVGDPDLYLFFRPITDGDVYLAVDWKGPARAPLEIDVLCIPWSPKPGDAGRLEAEPNNTWRQANPIELGKTIFATADDAPYIAVGEEREIEVLDRAVDWYRLEIQDPRPLLVFFEIDILDRDNIPVDVSVYRLENGNIVAHEEGMDPVSAPHEVQALPGNKFTTRLLRQGTYFVRVAASHPAYSLRTHVYDPPPYSDPRLAVRAGMDYLAAAGDSWHANTPRRGGITDRVANYHAETSTCIACHPTHFTTRANLAAQANGYPIRMRKEIQFLTERLYNNPRPFYGFPEASWSRLISASANVLSRLASLLNYFEHNISGEQRPSMMKGVAEYLKLYYRDRTTLPPDETNGNTPIVSTYEVAFYSWMVFDEMFHRTGDVEYALYRDRVRNLLEQNRLTNMLDLCYQTIALSTIDREAYKKQISANGERILSLQRPSGQWPMLFDAGAPEAEFQTGHCLYTLALAGYPASDPRIARGLRYVLSRQQSFGGWFDPLQSYENFRTPFRETQFAVMALSQYYKGPGARGWNLEPSKTESNPPLDLRRGLSSVLTDLDEVWEKPAAATEQKIVSLAKHPEALIRRAAMESLGRTGGERAVPALARGLSDPQKIVQYSAAWGLRQLAGRKGLGIDSISAALSSQDDRTRWGATRVFATHFSYLSGHLELARKLVEMMRDPSPVLRMQACKALWQWWYWNADTSFRDRVEDTFLERMAVERDPWVRRNLTEGFYNICDENVRYLYNNWIALLARPEDRERATRGHQASGTAQARKIARALEQGLDPASRNGTSSRYDARLLLDGVLTSLTQFHLRHSDPAHPEVFARIGNDIETIKFYPEAAALLEPALVKLVHHSSPAVRERAIQAGAIVRDNSLPLYAPAVARLLVDPEPKVRETAFRFYKTFPLPLEGEDRRVTVALLSDLLRSSYRTARLAALDLVASSRGNLAQEISLAETVKALAVQEEAELSSAALRAAMTFPSLMQDSETLSVPLRTLQNAVQKASSAQVPENLLAISLEIAFTQTALSKNPQVADLLDQFIARRDTSRWTLLLELAERNRAVLGSLQMLSLVSDAMVSPDESLARRARDLVRKNPSLARNPGIAAALVESVEGEAALSRPSDKATYAIPGPKGNASPATVPLDYGFFVQRVMPVLGAKGPDGAACVYCHATHTIFRLNPPPKQGDYSEAQLRENYRSALKVVDPDNPENSLILRKPLSTAEVEGTLGTGTLAHGGGQRWNGADHPAYKTILDWIRGAKLTSNREP